MTIDQIWIMVMRMLVLALIYPVYPLSAIASEDKNVMNKTKTIVILNRDITIIGFLPYCKY